ncbi:uncharacterized protein LOC133806859 [Humulus lupulus]|uniref:uncharacterized protein LOC133806859 n=1 Tax=Humulus lupulus TaxID=3486 RepID=UPI002B416FDC|nr:uncharacterized protein LOC133806859 [Humulus lupulus]
MSFFAEGNSITRPPLFNDTSYPYWKVKMRAFIKLQDEKAWRSILSGWTPPIEKDDEGFIKLISSCEFAKKAWKILQTQFEGTADVKRSRFTMLQTRFDELRMLETETLSEYYEKLSDIANEFFSSGEKLDESVLVRKFVRVLPDKFDMKLVVMEEAKDFGKMKVEELMGSLRTFELNKKIKKKGKPNPSIKKSKGIAFKVSEKDVSNDEKDDEMTLLTRNFQIFMKKVGLVRRGSSEEDNEKVALTSVLSSAFQERGKILCLNNTFTDVDNKEIDSDLDESKLNEESLAESYKGSVFTAERSVSTEIKQSGDKDFLVNIRPMQCGEVTFGNGLAGNVKGMGTFNFEGLPRLKNVMLVEGLRANLLSVSQICDQGIVRGLPKLGKEFVGKCEPCQLGKQLKISHKSIPDVNTSNVLELLHMDLMGPSQVESLNDCNIGKIVRIRSDHGKEFENIFYNEFCKSKGISHEFSTPKTPQQNGVVERKNRTLTEMARVMLKSKKLTKCLWAEAINTACYTINMVFL